MSAGPSDQSDPAMVSESIFAIIDASQCQSLLDIQVDISQVNVEEYPKTCGLRRLPILSLKNAAKWNEEQREKVVQLSGRYSHWRKSRGDGNCYYRAVYVAYLEHLCRLSTPPREMYDFYVKLRRQDNILVQEMLVPHVKHFFRCFPLLYEAKKAGGALFQLQEMLQDPYFDISAVGTFRCIACKGLVELGKSEMAAFFTLTSGVEGLLKEAQTMGKEAEGLAFRAMAITLDAKIVHVTLMGGLQRDDEYLPETKGRKVVLHVLFKGGHYDMLYSHGAQVMDRYSYTTGTFTEQMRAYKEVQDLIIDKQQ